MRTREFNRTATALLGLTLLTLSACKVTEDGIAGVGGRPVDVVRPDSGPRKPSTGGDSPSTAPAAAPDGGAAPAPAPAPEPAPDGGADSLPDPAAPDAGAADVGPASIAPDPSLRPARCSAALSLPVAARFVANGPRSDDITFDRDGHFISFEGRSVVRISRNSDVETLASNVIGMRGGTLRALPSGDILLADFERSAVLVQPLVGPIRRLPSSVANPMKMVRGPNGAVYITSKEGAITRVDESDGTVTKLATTPFELGGLTFSRDYKVLYVGALEPGAIHALPLRADGTLGPPRMFRGQIPIPQALATDECGNIYVVSEGQTRIRRVSDSGALATVTDLPNAYPWSLAFGSGKQGWSETTLYVHDGKLFEVPLGVAGQAAPPPGPTSE